VNEEKSIKKISQEGKGGFDLLRIVVLPNFYWTMFYL
jgi:hypothetical protein